MARSRPRFVASSTLLVAALVGGSLAAAAAPAAAVSPTQSTVVNAVPAGYTPNINDGITYAIGSVGSTIVVGGSFTNESPHGSTTVNSQPYLFSFTEGTGVINTSFAPTLDGEVDSIAAGPAANQVYVAGAFKTVNGVKERVALLNTTTGQLVPGWKPAALNGNVNKIELDGNQLIVGGYFTTANTVARAGLASLNATTGALTDYAANQFTGHHNYGVNCDPTQSTCASAGTGIKSFDISPDGTRLAVIGNFTSVDGSPRDQVALLDLGATSSAVDPNWKTLAYSAACYSGSFDTYVRDVQFAPDGSYFVIVGTGGSGNNSDGTRSSCDSAARYGTTTTGVNIRPTWIDYTGNDTLLSVAISGTAIYAGGHQRWLNNSMGTDYAGAGAVARPGIVAFDPQNGLPLAWNPGRNPRGAGAYSVLLTSRGLYVGSDTDYIGDDAYLHKKLAFFPLVGGETLPANTVGSLPGSVYLIGGSTGASSARSLSWDGSSTPGAVSTLPGSIDWSVAHGAFEVNGEVYYAESDGYLHQRSFDGKTFGPDVTVDPYDDPAWDTVKTGSGGSTPYYRGVQSTMSAEMPNVTSMFYSAGRIYYTLNGSSSMFWRWFEPDSGVIGADEFTTTDSNNWNDTAGAFLVGSTLYFAKSSGSSLYSVPFQNGQANGSPAVANNSLDWRSAGAFVLANSQIDNAPPTAAFTSSCGTSNSTCSFNASASSDSDGSIASYAWSFGDGATDTTTSATDAHTYSAAGAYTVTLTVTDNDGATNSVSHTANAGVAAAQPVAYVGANTQTANAATVATQIPAGTQAGNALVLSESFASTALTLTAPSGWTLVGTTSHSNLTTDIFERVAQAGDAGSTVTLHLSGTVKSSLVIAAYANTDKSAPVESSASTVSASNQTVTAPALSGLSDGTFVVRIYIDKSSATTGWTAPADATTRKTVVGTGAGAASTLLVDSNGAVGSSVPADSASTNDKSGSEAAWTIALKQVSAG